jgi:hypothetical protein
MVFGFPYRAMRTLAVTLALGALLAMAMASTAILVTMVTPVIVGCCVVAGAAVVAAAPVMGCVALIVAFAYFFKP